MSAPWHCPDCHQPHPRGCHGHVDECTTCQWRGLNQPGRPCHKCGGPVELRPCRKSPRVGGTHCAHHGGNSPNAQAGIERRTTATAIAGQVATLLAEVTDLDQHPIDGLLDAVHRTGAMMRALGQIVGGLNLQPDGPAATATSLLYGPDHLGDGRPHVAVDMYRTWTELHTRACKLALDAGIDERRLQLAANDVEQLFAAFARAVATVGLTHPQRLALQAALAGEIRALNGPAPLPVR